MTSPPLREWLREAPFVLGLSSGFFGFFAHTGVMTVLEDEGLTPAGLSGSSAGALVAGVWASGVDSIRLRDELLGLQRADFWDPAPGLGLLRGELFHRRLEKILLARSFADCRAPLRVSVFDVLSRKTRVVAEGPLAPAIQASCTVPLLFHPRWVDGRPLLDGGIADRPGLDGAPAGARVLYHHLSSRSPWRWAASNSLQIPRRPNLTALDLGDLPRVGPFRLGEGARAFEIACTRTRAALSQPV